LGVESLLGILSEEQLFGWSTADRQQEHVAEHRAVKVSHKQ
jgi:hypothetical protein